MSRLICWLIAVLTLGLRGHAWRIVRRDFMRMIGRSSFHELAGCDAICTRCDATWLDAGDPIEQVEKP